MKKKANPDQTEKSSVQVQIAKYVLVGTIVTAILGFVGATLNAYWDYRGKEFQVEKPINATLTAEAKITESMKTNFVITNTQTIAPANAPLHLATVPATRTAVSPSALVNGTTVTVTFSVAADSVGSAILVITSPKDKTTFRLQISPGTEQTISLPQGNYSYSLEAPHTAYAPPSYHPFSCDQVQEEPSINTQGTFTATQNGLRISMTVGGFRSVYDPNCNGYPLVQGTGRLVITKLLYAQEIVFTISDSIALRISNSAVFIDLAPGTYTYNTYLPNKGPVTGSVNIKLGQVSYIELGPFLK